MSWLRRDMHDLSGAYALDAVSEAERQRFERHLARCSSCRREVSDLQEAAGRFALAMSARPPAGLRTRVLRAVASDAPEASPAGTGLREALPPGTRPRRTRRTRQTRQARETHQPRRPGLAWRVAIPVSAACLAVAIVFGVLFAITQGRLNSSQSQEDAIGEVLSAPGTRMISHKTSIGGIVTFDVASGMRELVVTARDLPALPASEAYQLWVLKPGGRVASDGLLTRIPDDRTAPVLATGLVRGDKMSLTVEPAGGTAKPTTHPIADISVPG